MGSTEKCQSMIIDGNKLEIIATNICDGEWSLCIRNIHGIRTEWCEFFESADDAFEAGRQALETEDIETFISTEGFEY
jgi:hypothetical protein